MNQARQAGISGGHGVLTVQGSRCVSRDDDVDIVVAPIKKKMSFYFARVLASPASSGEQAALAARQEARRHGRVADGRLGPRGQGPHPHACPGRRRDGVAVAGHGRIIDDAVRVPAKCRGT